MLLHTVYTVVIPANNALDISLPLTISLDARTKASLVELENGIQLLIDCKVDPTKLELVRDHGRYKELPDGKQEPIPTLRLVDDEAPEHILSQDFISTLTFLTDVPITLSKPPHSDRFVPETDEDRELLDRLGTNQPYSPISALVSMRSL